MGSLHSIADAQKMKLTIANEEKKTVMLRMWILSGLFFMALPGTLLGFSNLMAISTHHGLGTMSPAWMEGHGHAQVFGWIGSFVLGIGFYSQPARGRSVIRIPLTTFLLWTSGVLLRWLGNIYEWHWRSLLMVSASFELLAVLLFLSAASHHKRSDTTPAKGVKPAMPVWMIAVFLSTFGLLAAVLFNFVECVHLAIAGKTPSFPHLLDQKYLVVLGWAFLAPVVWGFSARWLPTFLAIEQPHARAFRVALLLDVLGLFCGVSGLFRAAVLLLTAGAIIVVFAMHLFTKPHGRAKVQGIHPSFPVFLRLAYGWLLIAGAMSIWAAFADGHGGIWGASRHALTVGFAATMVFCIGPRILPNFCGIDRLFSKQLMLASLLLLQIGCTLRVTSEPLAYEGFANFAWKVLPISGMLELSGVLVFAFNLAVTLLFGRSAFELARRHSPAA